MVVPEIRKQISIFIPISDWQAIRFEAARKKIPMTELCRRWMENDLSKLRKENIDRKTNPNRMSPSKKRKP
ncbi:MAG: hypothetical protein Tsb009_29130 [Planctomycetaceae bacterium]